MAESKALIRNLLCLNKNILKLVSCFAFNSVKSLCCIMLHHGPGGMPGSFQHELYQLYLVKINKNYDEYIFPAQFSYCVQTMQ